MARSELPQSPNLGDVREVGSLHHEVPHFTCRTTQKGPTDGSRQLVLAFYSDEPAADNAAAALKDSGIAHGEAIGILALDSNGKLKQDKVGARSTGKGAAIGGVLFLLGPAVLGVGVVGGAVAGALHHKNLGLSDADKARLTTELNAGKAAVAVMAHSDTAPAISDQLTQLGGTSESHELSDEALQTASAGTSAV